MGEGAFKLTPRTAILFEQGHPEVESVGRYLAQFLQSATGYQLTLKPTKDAHAAPGSILLTTSGANEGLGSEGYELIVSKESVTLRAPHPAGLFYAVQTIRQLLPPAIEDKGQPQAGVAWQIPCLQIEDQPRYQWRGMLLDCGRHFMTKEFIKRYLDLLACYKMNRFHWHLTEDQGWRIEIKKYPKLTTVGAWRGQGENTYGGFYTQQDIREIVAYAKARHITVVPEIEMPGHCSAALASYPELSCTGGPFAVPTGWGVFRDVYCAGNDAVFRFLEDVLSEVVELFPAPYVHLGADEVPKDRWKDCPKCQARIKAEGLRDEYELQSYFIKRIAAFLHEKGRRVIGWDEIMQGGLAPGVIVQAWHGHAPGAAAAKRGHDVIVSPASHCYFNHDVRRVDLGKVYSFDPLPAGLDPSKSHHILGGECNMWTEHAPQQLVDSKIFPRILALAEVLWSPKEGKDFDEFYNRVENHYKRLNLMGVTYGRAFPHGR